MRIAVVGGGPGGLYFSALVKQLDPTHEVTVWERNAPDDTFGFGVVFSDETLGGIEHADPVVFGEMERHFARWDDIDVHYRGTTTTSGRARLRRDEPQGAARASCSAGAPTSASPSTSGRRGAGPRAAAGGVRPRPRRRRRPVPGARRLRRRVPPDPRDPAQQVHVAGHRPGLRGLQVLRRGDAARRHADPRLPLRPHRQHVHRRDARRRLAAGVRRRRGDGPARRARATPSRSSWSSSCSPTSSTATGCSRTTRSGSTSCRCATRPGGTATWCSSATPRTPPTSPSGRARSSRWRTPWRWPPACTSSPTSTRR